MGLCLLAVFGVFLAHFGFQYISVAYLLAAIATMVISSAEVYQCLKRPGGSSSPVHLSARAASRGTRG